MNAEEIKPKKIYFYFASTVIFTVVYIFCFFLFFGLEYNERFKDGYTAPTFKDKIIAILIFTAVISIEMIIFYFLNRKIEKSRSTFNKLIKAILDVGLIVALGLLLSFPVMIFVYTSFFE